MSNFDLIYSAAINKDTATLEKLFAAGVCIDIREDNEELCTPAEKLARNGYFEAADFLIDYYGANVIFVLRGLRESGNTVRASQLAKQFNIDENIYPDADRTLNRKCLDTESTRRHARITAGMCDLSDYQKEAPKNSFLEYAAWGGHLYLLEKIYTHHQQLPALGVLFDGESNFSFNDLPINNRQNIGLTAFPALRLQNPALALHALSFIDNPKFMTAILKGLMDGLLYLEYDLISVMNQARKIHQIMVEEKKGYREALTISQSKNNVIEPLLPDHQSLANKKLKKLLKKSKHPDRDFFRKVMTYVHLGANPNSKDKSGDSILHLLVKRISSINTELQRLNDRPSDKKFREHQRDYKEDSKKLYSKMIETLVRFYNADIYVKDANNLTPSACYYYQDENDITAALLRKFGAGFEKERQSQLERTNFLNCLIVLACNTNLDSPIQKLPFDILLNILTYMDFEKMGVTQKSGEALAKEILPYPEKVRKFLKAPGGFNVMQQTELFQQQSTFKFFKSANILAQDFDKLKEKLNGKEKSFSHKIFKNKLSEESVKQLNDFRDQYADQYLREHYSIYKYPGSKRKLLESIKQTDLYNTKKLETCWNELSSVFNRNPDTELPKFLDAITRIIRNEINDKNQHWNLSYYPIGTRQLAPVILASMIHNKMRIDLNLILYDHNTIDSFLHSLNCSLAFLNLLVHYPALKIDSFNPLSNMICVEKADNSPPVDMFEEVIQKLDLDKCYERKNGSFNVKAYAAAIEEAKFPIKLDLTGIPDIIPSPVFITMKKIEDELKLHSSPRKVM